MLYQFLTKCFLFFYKFSGYQPENIVVYLAPSDQSKKKPYRTKKHVHRIVMHNFTWIPKINDIALLQLKTPINFDEYIQPICLVGKNDIFTSKSSCWSSGYGYTSSSKNSCTYFFLFLLFLYFEFRIFLSTSYHLINVLCFV